MSEPIDAETVAEASEDTAQALRYRLLTGPDDRSFCEKVSAALDEGYILYGSPSLSRSDGQNVVAQAVILSLE